MNRTIMLGPSLYLVSVVGILLVGCSKNRELTSGGQQTVSACLAVTKGEGDGALIGEVRITNRDKVPIALPLWEELGNQPPLVVVCYAEAHPGHLAQKTEEFSKRWPEPPQAGSTNLQELARFHSGFLGSHTWRGSVVQPGASTSIIIPLAKYFLMPRGEFIVGGMVQYIDTNNAKHWIAIPPVRVRGPNGDP